VRLRGFRLKGEEKMDPPVKPEDDEKGAVG